MLQGAALESGMAEREEIMRSRSFGKIVGHVLVICLITVLMLAGCRQSKAGRTQGRIPLSGNRRPVPDRAASGSEGSCIRPEQAVCLVQMGK